MSNLIKANKEANRLKYAARQKLFKILSSKSDLNIYSRYLAKRNEGAENFPGRNLP